jgi:hypothetical protein
MNIVELDHVEQNWIENQINSHQTAYISAQAEM